MIKNSIIITVLFFVSSILGFVCQMLYGKYFGVGGDMDIYYALNSIPNIVIGVVPAVFSSLLIPLFPQYEEKGDLEKLMVTLNGKVYIFALAVVILVGVLCVTQAFSIASKALKLALTMCVLLLATAFFSIVNGYYISYVNYIKKFVQVSLTSLMTYSSIILMVICFHSYFGVISIAMGLLLGSLLRFVTMRNIMALPRQSIDIQINYRRVLSRVLMIFATLLPFSAFPAIAYFWAGNMEEGAVSYLGYSHSFEGVLSVAGSMGVATVSFPDLAKSLNTKDKDKMISTLSRFMSTLKAVFFIANIIISFCCVFVIPVCSLLLERGEFDSENITRLSYVLPFYLIGGGIIALLNLIRNVFYSLKYLVKFSILSMAVTITFLLLAIAVGNKFSYIGVGATECSFWVLFLLLSIIVLVNKVGSFISFSDLVDCIKYIVVPLFVALCIKSTYDSFLVTLPLFCSMFICGVIHMAASIILLYLAKAKEAKILIGKIYAGLCHK